MIALAYGSLPPNEPPSLFPKVSRFQLAIASTSAMRAGASNRSSQQSRWRGSGRVGSVKLGDFTGGFHDLFTKETVEKSADLNTEAIAGTNPKLPPRPLPCFAPKPLPLSKAPETLELQAVGLNHTPATRSFIHDCKISRCRSLTEPAIATSCTTSGLAPPSATGLCSLVITRGLLSAQELIVYQGHRITSN